MASKTFTEDVEIVLGQAGIKLEESDKEDLEVSGGIHSVVWLFITSDRISNTDRAINEEKVVLVIPCNSLLSGD
jgi:hypothetical protein